MAKPKKIKKPVEPKAPIDIPTRQCGYCGKTLQATEKSAQKYQDTRGSALLLFKCECNPIELQPLPNQFKAQIK